MSHIMRKILLITAQGDKYQTAQRLAADFKQLFNEQKFTVGAVVIDLVDSGGRYDLAIAIGGDGTMMKTVTNLAPRNIPTLGVNAGDVGFLTSAEAADWVNVAIRIAAKEYEIEKRLGLKLTKGVQTLEPIANEVVLRHQSSVAKYQIAIGGQVFYKELMGDGVMVATATGSTGYNTSAGGPILLPGSGNVVVTPLNPMALSTRSIVSQELAEGKDITITLVESKRDEPVLVLGDGRPMTGGLEVGESVVITKYEHPLLFATFGLEQYAKALTEKKGFAR